MTLLVFLLTLVFMDHIVILIADAGNRRVLKVLTYLSKKQKVLISIVSLCGKRANQLTSYFETVCITGLSWWDEDNLALWLESYGFSRKTKKRFCRSCTQSTKYISCRSSR